MVLFRFFKGRSDSRRGLARSVILAGFRAGSNPLPRLASGVFLLGMLGALPLKSDAQSALSADAIIHRALARAQQVEAASGQHDYTYTKVSVTEELDGSGKLKERKERVYQVYFQGGSTHASLIEVNGHRPGPSDTRKQADNDSNLRLLLGQSKSATGDNRESFLTPELVARFDFRLLDRTTLDGREAYRIAFRPKDPPAPTHRMVDRLLDRISGTIWIDSEEFEVARAEVRLASEVDLLGGVVGCLKKLAYTMIRTRVADGVWLNSFSSADVEGRKLLDSLRIKTKSQSSNFKPLPMGG